MVEADSNQVYRGAVQSEGINTEGYVIPVVVPDADVSTLLTGYNPESIEPAITQEIVRAVLDALQQATS
jgi:hypothetical protein